MGRSWRRATPCSCGAGHVPRGLAEGGCWSRLVVAQYATYGAAGDLGVGSAGRQAGSTTSVPRRSAPRRPTPRLPPSDEPARKPGQLDPDQPLLDASTDASGIGVYRIERCSGPSWATSPSHDRPRNQSGTQNSGLTASTSYTYRARRRHREPAPNQSELLDPVLDDDAGAARRHASHRPRRTCPDPVSSTQSTYSPLRPPPRMTSVIACADRGAAPGRAPATSRRSRPSPETRRPSRTRASGLDLLHLPRARRRHRDADAQSERLLEPVLDDDAGAARHHASDHPDEPARKPGQLDPDQPLLDRLHGCRAASACTGSSAAPARAAATSPRSRPSPEPRRPSRLRASRPRPPTPTACAPKTP